MSSPILSLFTATPPISRPGFRRKWISAVPGRLPYWCYEAVDNPEGNDPDEYDDSYENFVTEAILEINPDWEGVIGEWIWDYEREVWVPEEESQNAIGFYREYLDRRGNWFASQLLKRDREYSTYLFNYVRNSRCNR